MWSPTSWLSKPRKHCPFEEIDEEEMRKTRQFLSQLPGVVDEESICQLKHTLSKVHDDSGFIIQGGDCAESFEDSSIEAVLVKAISLSLFTHIIQKKKKQSPVVAIGRIAGQYGKPRTSPLEPYHNKFIPSFKGVNVHEFSPENRITNPLRLILGYLHSRITYHSLQHLLSSWLPSFLYSLDLDLLLQQILSGQHSSVLDILLSSPLPSPRLSSPVSSVPTPIYTSHEALILHYESAILSPTTTPEIQEILSIMNSRADIDTAYYKLISLLQEPSKASKKPSSPLSSHSTTSTTISPVSTPPPSCPVSNPPPSSPCLLSSHMVWVGERTRQADHAHIEFCKGIANPVGIKVSSTVDVEELVDIIRTVNPLNEKGKVILITRMGRGKKELLREVVRGVKREEVNVLWQCDPMHGNGKSVGEMKTRYVEDIKEEIREAMEVHKEEGGVLHGIHLEFSGLNVTECVDGERVREENLKECYLSLCDPRLNLVQLMEIAMFIADRLE